MAAFDRPEYDRYVRLAEMMISFLRDHGYNYDTNLDQDILDHDGPGVPVENRKLAVQYLRQLAMVAFHLIQFSDILLHPHTVKFLLK